MSVIDWAPIKATPEQLATYALPGVPHVRFARFTANIAKSIHETAHSALTCPIDVSHGSCSPLVLNGTALRALLDPAVSYWLLLRAPTGALVAKARVTIVR